MTTAVRRTAHVLSSREGLTVLEQRFQFEGEGVIAAALAALLLTARLTGDNSVFGNRPGDEGDRTDSSRSLRGFSPAPGFRFDVDLTRREDGFIVRFSQPDRNVPYLEGEFLWTITDEGGGAVFDEQINTERAMESVAQPLDGARPSLRRWLFFRLGHKQVMDGAINNLATLLNRPKV